ncbi:MAG: hypothetical protein ACK41D_06770 [Rubricoccaceae bacterium]
MPTVTRTAPPAHPLALLFARYISGDLDARALGAVCDGLEDADASAEERAALAHFYLEALEEGLGADALPDAAEVRHVIGVARA